MSRLLASGGQSFNFITSPSNEYSVLIFFRIYWFDLLAVQGTFQHHNLKSSILKCSAFFIVLSSHLDMTTGKTIALIIHTFVSKVISLPFNTLSGFDDREAFLPRSNSLLVSWLQSLTTVILEPPNGKSVIASTFSPSICHEVMGPDVIILVFECCFSPAFFTLLFHPHQ